MGGGGGRCVKWSTSTQLIAEADVPSEAGGYVPPGGSLRRKTKKIPALDRLVVPPPIFFVLRSHFLTNDRMRLKIRETVMTRISYIRIIFDNKNY